MFCRGLDDVFEPLGAQAPGFLDSVVRLEFARDQLECAPEDLVVREARATKNVFEKHLVHKGHFPLLEVDLTSLLPKHAL